MMKIFKNFLSKEVDLEGVTDEELKIALDQIGRDLVYNYLLFGQDVTVDMFIENLKRYLYLNSHL
ncbi:hypothetical protein FYJ27_09605 [Anaerosalibacter bizertensis]|uniref:Uncharacterized protein n=1 Tax=Anaerosalibacter bizertensis TaxID=932217 RepID=A0A844FJ51_9FIRM|nr:hypothetical protein [Anaerosalibacter bizertensis]MCB5560467.1 hypothetical protein [Anaerosalibacter bizertensis]MCG4583335.1 hypothetical protein [Anaerosalibacter bizertensis]MSS43981.1 hypothetical protein [Anaerosalibacter bizertensis]